ncbi:hypothetical protein TanjilG_23908 [Lupinus angustifolius]|uniref:Pentacotripeptide-repeat region of PRORP domain-containing protein n=1 Tax=Lupinus angustifolius TaxID=3871 RepID=A0A1J7HR78_LUPAN|nr:PREDICTED: uncharacterized protein LOC109355964 [Lupinus angustifolius]OIW04905.1 hypothetical protein TanjilG_23908 [Lupinus angustifolius]
MASTLYLNLTFHKPLTPATSAAATRRSYIPVRCATSRSRRLPLLKGRILSIESLQAIQTLKRLYRTNPPNLTHALSTTLTRLIKSDLDATLRELLRQQQCTLALRVFHTLRSEYGADLTLHAEIAKALANCGMYEDLDDFIVDLEENCEIDCGDYKGLVNLMKVVIEAKRRESTVRIYRLMKKCGWGSVVEPDEYVVRVLVNGLKGFDEIALAEEVQNEWNRAFDNFSRGILGNLRV